jgi:hypothetical protein
MAKQVTTKKRGKEPLPPVSAPPPLPPARAAWVSLRGFVIRRWVPLTVGVVALLALILLYDRVTPTLAEAAPDPTTPLSFSFAVKAGWLPMDNVRVTCSVRNLDMKSVVPNVRVSAPDMTRTDSRIFRVADKSVRVFRCPIDIPGPYVKGTGVARVEYDALFLPRVLEGTFSWVGEVGRPRWVKGDLYPRGS